METVLQLDKIARNAHPVEAPSKLNADKILIERANSLPKIEVWANARVIEMVGTA